MGEHRDAVALALEASRLAEQQGELLSGCRSAWAASFLLAEELAERAEATRVLDQTCRDHEELAIVALYDSYHRGLLASAEGRFGRAQALLEHTARLARRLRWPRWKLAVLTPLAEALANQGRFGWARKALEHLHELDAATPRTVLGACDNETRYHRKLGTLALREAELHGSSPLPAREHWLEARTIMHDRSRCPLHSAVVDQAQRVDVDLARIAVELGELVEAKALLDGIPPDTIAAITDVRRRLGQAELALAKSQPEAAARILEDYAADRRRGSADAAGPEEDWREQLAWARVFQARADLRAVLGALARAQTHIDHDRSGSGVETDRQAAMRRKSSELLVRLLLEHGLERQALCTARVARARGLAWTATPSDQARDRLAALERARAALFEDYRWYDPRDIPIDQRLRLDTEQHELETTGIPRPPVECDQLPALAPNEASLLYYSDGEGLVGFGWNAEGLLVVARILDGPYEGPPKALGEVLIEPLARVLQGATLVRVLAPASMHELSFADLPWQGRPLGDQLSVAHALDLPRIPLRDRRPSAALVFSDPSRKLLREYSELEPRFRLWHHGLERAGLSVPLMVGPSKVPQYVSVTRILEDTRGAELVLLYGFGATKPTTYDLGTLGMHEPEEPEPDQDGFGVGADALTRLDVLHEVGAVPRRVILAHCKSATVDELGVSGAIGLAQSYVQAGSEWSIGAIGAIAPESMEVIVDELMASDPQRATAREIATALQRAKRALAERGLAGATHVRLWVP